MLGRIRSRERFLCFHTWDGGAQGKRLTHVEGH